MEYGQPHENFDLRTLVDITFQKCISFSFLHNPAVFPWCLSLFIEVHGHAIKDSVFALQKANEYF